MRVLLVEDDPAMARSVELMLRSEGMNVYTTELGEEGIDLAKLYDYDIVVLNIQLPDMSGFEVIKALRLTKVTTPILILSGNAIVEAKVKALNLGADDYVTKPFHKDELVARIQAVVRRSRGHPHSIITTGKLAVDLTNKTARINGNLMQLGGKEYQVLEILSLHKGTKLIVDALSDQLGYGPAIASGAVQRVVQSLRKKIAVETDGDDYIETVRDDPYGYRLKDPPS